MSKILQNRTKLVATIGPSSCDPKILERLIDSGLDVARINFSHAKYDLATTWVNDIRKISERKNQPVAVLQDLQGPRIRIGADLSKTGLQLEVGQVINIGYGKFKKGFIPIDYQRILKDIKKGTRVLLVDGLVELEVLKVEKKQARTRVNIGGKIFPRKGVNIPNAALSISSLSEKDREDLVWGIENDVDYVALSFVRNADDIKELRKLILKHDANSKIKIIAKIEKPEAIKNLRAIVKESDAIMVARGDLGIELLPEDVPLFQKKIIFEAIKYAKPVITATQMMESMITNPRPTRAEVSDVANAILDGTDAVMLSGETANGVYPVEVVKMMTRIISEIEKDIFDRDELHFDNLYHGWQGFIKTNPSAMLVADAVGYYAKLLAEKIDAKYLVVETLSGYSARMVSRNRPKTPIVAASPVKKIVNQLGLVWGVRSFYVPLFKTTDELICRITEELRQSKRSKKGDKIVIVCSHPIEKSGYTNLIKVEELK